MREPIYIRPVFWLCVGIRKDGNLISMSQSMPLDNLQTKSVSLYANLTLINKTMGMVGGDKLIISESDPEKEGSIVTWIYCSKGA